MNTYDVAVIGGGIIGASSALALAGEGLRVIVFDRQMPGREASWAAGGMLSPAPFLPGDEALVPLASESLRLYPEFIRTIEAASGKRAYYRREGAFELFFGENASAGRDRFVAICRSLHLNVEALAADEARKVEPLTGPAAEAAAFFPSEATVEPRALMDALIEALRLRGVAIRADCPVQSLMMESSRCVGVVANGERVHAKHVVIAAGCFSHELADSAPGFAKELVPYLRTRPVRGQMLALRAEGLALGHVVRSAEGYLVPRSDGSIVAGSTLEEAGFEKKVTREGIHKIQCAAIDMIPALAGATLVDSWSGLRPGTPDGLPILGPVEIEGLVLATGHFRNGILLAPITAQLVKAWITGSAMPFDASSYSPLRFAPRNAPEHSVR